MVLEWTSAHLQLRYIKSCFIAQERALRSKLGIFPLFVIFDLDFIVIFITSYLSMKSVNNNINIT